MRARLGNPGKNCGVDLATEAIAFCQQRGLENVRQADICNLPFADESFDAVISSSVIYHEWVANVGTAMREMWRVLRPGGLLILNVPAFRFLHSAHDEAVMTASSCALCRKRKAGTFRMSSPPGRSTRHISRIAV